MIKGEVKLVLRNSETGEIEYTHEQSNEFTVASLARTVGYVADTVNDTYSIGKFLFIANTAQPSNRLHDYVARPYEIGFVEPGIQSPQFFDVAEPGDYYVQYQNRFDPPVTNDRDINVIGIQWTGATTTVPTFGQSQQSAAYVGLSTTCVQTTSQTLDVFYRLVFPWDETETRYAREQFLYLISRGLNKDTVDLPTWEFAPHYNNYYMTGKIDSSVMQKSDQQFSNAGRTDGSGRGYINGTTTHYPDFVARTQDASITLANITGRIIGTLSYAADLNSTPNYNNYTTRYHSKLLKSTDSPVQNTFPHALTATGPFYASVTNPTSTGLIEINGDSWTNPDFPILNRIDIIGSGDIGVSTYKVSQRRTVGFVNNTYLDDHTPIPFLGSQNHEVLGNVWDGEERYTTGAGRSPMAIPYDVDNESIVIFDKTWVGIINAMTGVAQRWDSSTTPAADFVNTYQVCVDKTSGDIWVAAETGAFRLDSAGAIVDQFNPSITASLSGVAVGSPPDNNCRGITMTSGGTVWAYFAGGLASSSDSGVSWTTYTSALSGAITDFSKVWFIQGDPSHADDRIAIAYAVTTSGNLDLDIHWWDRVSDAVSTNKLDSIWVEVNASYNPTLPREISGLFTCSPNQNKWGAVRRLQAAGSTGSSIFNWDSTSALASAANQRDDQNGNYIVHRWVLDSSGDDAMIFHSHNSTDPRGTMLTQAGVINLTHDLHAENPLGGLYQYWDDAPRYGIKAILNNGIVVFTTKGNTSGAGLAAWMVGMYSDRTDAYGGEWKNVLWDQYGWNGASWELNHAGAKATHAGHQAIVDGLTVAFDAAGSPAGTFVATDNFTTAIVDGIMSDAATTFEHHHLYYWMPAEYDTNDLETGTLSGSTSTALCSPGLSWVDIAGTVDENGIPNSTGVDGGRSVQEAKSGEDFIVKWRFDVSSGTATGAFGLCQASKKGTALDDTTADYIFKIVGGGTAPSSPMTIAIRENSAVDTVSVDDGSAPTGFTYSTLNTTNDTSQYFKIERVGTTIRYYVNEALVHTSVVASGTDLCLYGNLGTYIGAVDVKFHHQVHEYFVPMGNSTLNTGIFDPLYYRVVTLPESNISVKINGVEATRIADNDLYTTLSSGEVSIIRQTEGQQMFNGSRAVPGGSGHIRYSSTDAGKAITATYTYLKHQT